MSAHHNNESDSNSLLDSFGVEIAHGYLKIANLARAEKVCIHHSYEPVAAVVYALISPSFCRGKLSDYKLVDLIRKSGCLDTQAINAFAEVCGTYEIPPYRSTAEFCKHLHMLIGRYSLENFFVTVQRTIQGIDVRPAGIDWENPNHGLHEMAKWRREYSALPETKKMLVASILWLYRGHQNDSPWMTRLPRKWLAADAIVALKSADMLADWGRLFALYAGW